MRRHSFDLVIVIALFCVYAACSLLLCVIGADVYRATANTMQYNYDQRTSVLYVAEKLRQNDLEGTVRVDNCYGVPALVLVEQVSGQEFETWLFVQDQILYEGVLSSGQSPDVRLCQKIMPMDSMDIALTEGDGRRVSVTFNMVDGRSTSIDFTMRSSRLVGA